MNELLNLSGTRQATLIKAGEISSTELVQAHLARIEKTNPSLNAVVEVLADSALLEASAVDQRKAAGQELRPLEGVPFSIKDSIEVAGTVCSAGTLGRKNEARSVEDATLVARLRAAGAIPLARTNLPDLLFSFETDNLIFGRTNNPFDVTRSAGGSSGGEAALIAAGGSPFGIGSDSAGSVRLPAHYCGIASIKPTTRRLSRAGHMPPSGGWLEMLWQIGPMARHVEDLWTMMPLLVGDDPRDPSLMPIPWRDPALVDLKNLRIGFFTDNGIVAADADTDRVVRRAAGFLSSQVHSVEERRPKGIEQTYDLEMQMIGPDGGDALRSYLAEIGSHQIHPLLEGWLVKLEPYRTDLKGFGAYWGALDAFRAQMARYISGYDAILSPVASQPAVLHGCSIEDQVFRGFSYTMTYNLTGWPAAVVRGGTSQNGLPIGVQIAAAPWREDIALAVARALEQLP